MMLPIDDAVASFSFYLVWETERSVSCDLASYPITPQPEALLHTAVGLIYNEQAPSNRACFYSAHSHRAACVATVRVNAQLNN